jgi:hypothetical protein
MSFFESIKQGVLGLLLFAGNWVMPENDAAVLKVESIRRVAPSAYHVTLTLSMSLNQQLEQLIDAGVPLNFRFSAISDRADTVCCLRSLRCNVADLTYFFSDSSHGTVVTSPSYPMVLLALRDFTKWEFNLPLNATACRAEAEIRESRVSQLNRTVDMSRIWGHQKVAADISLNAGRP